MPSAIFDLCDEYVTRYTVLDPLTGHVRGIVGDYGVVTDFGPEGVAARAGLVDDTLRRLTDLPVGDERDARAARYLRDRLTVEREWHEIGEPYRLVRAAFGPLRSIAESVRNVRPGPADDMWRLTLDRLAAVPPMLASWRAGLSEGLSRGLVEARRQPTEAALQAERFAGGVHDELLASYGGGPLADALAGAVRDAYAAYLETARYLREEYAPRAVDADGVGEERHAVYRRMCLGADIDPREAYDWGWDELRRIEDELAAEAKALGSDTVEQAIARLDETESVDGPEAYRAWLQERHDQALERLDGAYFDLAPGLERVEVMLLPSPGASGVYYTPPSEDLARPGRTWWALGGRERFGVWGELTTVFHEGVPGHHLQIGQDVAGTDRLSRFSRTFGVSGHSEGWALYAERLADELGWYDAPGTRLGMLKAQALKTCRVVVDLGLHLNLPLPAREAERYGPRWSFALGELVLATRGRCAPHRVHPEVVRYCGLPAQAIGYKLGERAWLAARDRARADAAFDLKRWHTAALNLGPVGLAALTAALPHAQY